MVRTAFISILALTVFLPCRVCNAVSSEVPLTTLKAIHALTNQQADKAIPVEFEANVIYYRHGNVDMFVQDGEVAVYVETSPDQNLATGDRVLIRGVTRASFRPEVASNHVVFLRHEAPPRPIRTTYRQLVRAELDCRRVTVRAMVHSANSVLDAGSRSTYLQLLMDGGEVDAEVFGSVSSGLAELLDAEVEITGAVAGKFDSKMQMTGILLEVASLSDLKVIRRAAQMPSSLPITPMDEILKAYDVLDRTKRIKVEGTLTYYQPGFGVVLQDGAKSLWIKTQYEEPLRIGQMASATGFPEVDNGFLTLVHAELEPSGVRVPVAPRSVTPSELARGTHASDLISVEGRLLMAVREAAQDEYVLVSGNHLFSAVYRHPGRATDETLPDLNRFPVGAMVRVTGICKLEKGDFSQGPAAFEVLLRAPEDVEVIAKPPWLNVRNLVQVVGVLLLIVLGIGTRAWAIERRLRNSTARMVQIEQMRNELLGQINRSRPLPDILSGITQLVSFTLHDATCWCSMEGEESIGEPPADLGRLRVIDTVIAARSGPPYGILHVALPKDARPSLNENNTLSMAAELATVAIETSRTVSDLRMRSEFDLLTGLHNRFALEKNLEALRDKRLTDAGIRGLIYLDLDEFKQVNDTYGHHFGDLYLREVAARMKRQIRPTDFLARLGGDEFAVVVTGARTRSDVEEIASRLEHCFDQPFDVEEHSLNGSASFGIAYCPEDGVTMENLLKAADAAMYEHKRARHHTTAFHA